MILAVATPPRWWQCVCVCACLRRLGHGFEGLQYEVGLVDEPVCADEDVYCPGNREEVAIIRLHNQAVVLP